MDEQRYQELLGRLSSYLSNTTGSKPFVSPVCDNGRSGRLPDSLFIKKDMQIDGLSNNGVILMHTLLHRFFGSGTANLTREDIKNLHEKIKVKLNSHKEFDSLDR